MSRKHDCEQAIKEARHWREVARNQSAELAEMKRQLERVSDLSLALAGHGGIADKYQRERDHAVVERKILRSLLQGFFEEARQLEASSAIQLTKWEEIASKHIKESGIPSSAIWLYNAVTKAKEDLAQDHNDFLEEHNLIDQPVLTDPISLLVSARSLIQLAGVQLMAVGGLMKVMINSDAPTLICADIISECRHRGHPTMEVLERLPIEWLKDRFADSPKLSTLKEALTLLQEEQRSGLYRRQFAKAKGISESVLRKYQQWWEIIETESLKAPEELRETIDRVNQQMIQGS